MTENTHESDRRRFTRILFDAPITLKTSSGHIDTRLIDISLKGALVRIDDPSPFATGAPVTLTLHLDEAQAQIVMQMSVAHSHADHVGMLCEEIDMDSITHLRRLVELNLGDSELLERELEALG
jgi:hypothetical protein